MSVNRLTCLLIFIRMVQWWFMPIANNRVGWMVTRDIRKQLLDRKRSYHSSEWGPEAALEMCNKVRHFRTPYRGTIGDMFDQTPQELISKVALEDKVQTPLLNTTGVDSVVTPSLIRHVWR